jgi:hypothetical protein
VSVLHLRPTWPIIRGPSLPRALPYLLTPRHFQRRKPLSNKNRCQTMLYLEALRRHLPEGKFPAGALTNLTRFIFYRSTGVYSFAVSNPIETVDQVAWYLYDLHVCAKRLDDGIERDCLSRTALNIEWPFGNAAHGQFDEGPVDADAEVEDEDILAAGGTAGVIPQSTVTLLTGQSLKRHDNELLVAARRRLALYDP